ncbi:restriction alleviation protein [Vibrio phage 1.054.O._10N.261.52.A1]|nr:restriction alleviation protein [Vibrio phage 1.054.O._10N.261.52.A1]
MSEVKMSEELKPCPFCGRDPAMHFGSSKSVVGCFSAHCSVNPSVAANTITIAREKWNTRKQK